MDVAAARAREEGPKTDVRGGRLLLSLCLLVLCLAFVGTGLLVSHNDTVDTVGMIAVMTGWHSKTFRAVFPPSSFDFGTHSGNSCR